MISPYIFEEPNYEPTLETYIGANEELLIPFPSTPIPTFAALNQITGGLRPYEFSILCGATGIGKTTLIANLSYAFLLQKIPHFVASVETGRKDFVKRVMSVAADEDWNTGDAIPIHKVKAFHEKQGHLFTNETLHLSRYEDRFNVSKLMNDIAWMVHHRKCKVAMIDNLNFFLDVTSENHQIAEMDRVVHDLVIFCKRVEVHLIMVMHPKKTDDGQVRSEFHIKGSSTAVQESHNIFLYNRASPTLINSGVAQPHDRELTLAKMRRRGKSVGSSILLGTKNGVRLYERGII